jgi:hypothetical protein
MISGSRKQRAEPEGVAEDVTVFHRPLRRRRLLLGRYAVDRPGHAGVITVEQGQE